MTDEQYKRLDRLLARLRAVAERSGHDPDRLRIVAVTKARPVEVPRAAIDAGLTMLGESRIQEAEPKIASTADLGASWHLVGHLQSNKARKAAALFGVVQSVDSMELGERLSRVGVEEGRRVRALVQVDLAEAAKLAGAA